MKKTFKINGSTNDIFVSVKAAFTTQIGSTSKLNAQNVDVWDYSTEEDGTTFVCQVRCFFDSGIVVVMYEKAAVTANYMEGRAIFQTKTGVLLPLIAGVDADYPPETAQDAMLDLGEGVSDDIFETIKDFFDNLDGWTYDEESHNQSGVFENFYYESTSGARINLCWHRENDETVGIYINAFSNQ